MENSVKAFNDDKQREKIDESLVAVDNASGYAYEILDKVVSGYTKPLDDIMISIKEEIVDNDIPAPIELVEKYFIELSNCLYFIGESSEKLGLYDSISKAVAKEAYNNSYTNDEIALDDKGKKRTVAELTALSENAVIYEQTVSDIYNKAYKTVKVKVSAGENMCSTLSKIMSRRMSEMQLSSTQPATFNTKKILNESVQTNWVGEEQVFV